MFSSLFVVILGLCYCSNESSQLSLEVPLLRGPSEALVNKAVDFECEIPNHPEDVQIILQLFKMGDRSKLLGEYTSLPGEDGVIPIIVKRFHEGYLECVASAQNKSISNITETVSYPHYLKVIEPVKGAEIFSSDSLEFYEGKTLELRCKVRAGNHISYKWLINGRLLSQSPLRYFRDDQLLIFRTTSEDSGSYSCEATNTFNNTEVFTSSSPEVVITVKDLVSDPDIFFTVIKEDSQNYSAVVTCESTRGYPPITFSLYNRTELVTNVTTLERFGAFKVPLVMGRHLGWLQCRANNGGQIAHSQWIPLKVGI